MESSSLYLTVPQLGLIWSTLKFENNCSRETQESYVGLLISSSINNSKTQDVIEMFKRRINCGMFTCKALKLDDILIYLSTWMNLKNNMKEKEEANRIHNHFIIKT